MGLRLADTSAWVEWLRTTGSAADKAVRCLRDEPQSIALTQPVRMEILIGVPEKTVMKVSSVLDRIAVDLRCDSALE